MGDIENKAEDLLGKAKEGVGEVAGDDSLKNEGKKDQVLADAKEALSDAGEKIKDTANKVIGSLKGDK